MAYIATALSFMLENLGKAVVLTGSMIPLAEVYNDARRNLLISIVFAAQLDLCECAIFFNDRAARASNPPQEGSQEDSTMFSTDLAQASAWLLEVCAKHREIGRDGEIG